MAKMASMPSKAEECFSLQELSNIIKNGDVDRFLTVVDALRQNCGQQDMMDHLSDSEHPTGSCLHQAAFLGRSPMVKKMLDCDVPPSPLDKASTTPLHLACERGQARCAYLLIQAGADKSNANSFGKRPEDLLEVKSWTDEECAKGITLISKMMKQGLKAVEYDALPQDTPMNDSRSEEVNDHDSPYSFLSHLPQGVSDEFNDLFSSLTTAGMDLCSCAGRNGVESQNLQEVPAFEDVVALSFSDRAYTAKQKQLCNELELKVMSGDALVLQKHIDAMVKHESRIFVTESVLGAIDDGSDSRNSSNPLFLAIDTGHVEVLKVLLSTGVPINSTDLCGDTLLHKSAAKGLSHISAYLLSAAADPNIKNSFGRTPIDSAQKEPWDTPCKEHAKQEIGSLLRRESLRRLTSQILA